jgi:CBS domain containing-hemolysin-like protein
MEWLIWLVVLLILLALVLVESVNFGPSALSQAEIERLAAAGDKTAKAELKKRKLLPLYYGLQRLKVSFLVVSLVGVLASMYTLWLALAASLGGLLLVGLMVANGWLGWLARLAQRMYEPYVWKLLKAGAPVFRLFAPRINGGGEVSFASKEELRRMVEQDVTILSADEKARLIAAMHFDGKKVSDAMVPVDKIATVGQSETVGPLLLDKLHKIGHNVIVVTGKNIDSVKGLLYMSDLVPLDPEIQTVKDAMRTKVFYVSADAPLAEVLSASAKTGRQLFLAAKDGRVIGLITLADALEHLIGTHLSKTVEVTAKP